MNSRILVSEIRDLSKLKPTEISYLAGIIDGEGTISLGRVPPSQRGISQAIIMRLQITNTDRRLLDWILERCGGRINIRSRKATNPKHKTQWTWRPPDRINCAEILRKCLPYLVIKGRQAELFLELLDLRLKSSNKGVFHPERQQEIVSEVQRLNKRGPGIPTGV